jgi:xanthine dehydrogenase accessory factor
MPRYLGLVASEKKARSLFEYVREKGATDEQIAAIKSPAGIELGGETMPEIALSVMAEITRVRRANIAERELAGTKPAGTEAAETEPEETDPEENSDTRSLEAWDPICGMAVNVQNARYTSVLDGKTFYFCCLRCKETFEEGNG